MARKSPWQEFAENFQGVYGTFQKIGQDVETGRIMDDEKFTAEGKAGAGLSGGALEKARYKALGDIYTKYGNAKDGLAVRTQLAGLESAERKNELGAATLQEQIKQNGLLKSAVMQSQAYQNNASGRNSDASANNTTALTPERVAKLRADTDSVMDGNYRENQKLSGFLAQQNATLNSTNANTAQTEEQTTGLGIDNSSKLTQQPSANAAAISGFELLKAQHKGDLANIDLRDQANAELFTTSIQEAKAKDNQAQINELQTLGFLDYSRRFSDGEFKTGKDAAEAYVNVVAAFDPFKATELSKNYTETEIAAIANDGLKFQSNVSALVQKNDFEGIRAFFDEQNGDATGVTLDINAETGAIKMFQTGAGGEIIPIMDAPNAAEARAQLESVTTYGNAASYAESLFARRKGEAEIAKTEALTDQATATAEFTTENTRGLAGGRKYNAAQINLANVRAREIRAELRQKYTPGGKAELKVQADQKALDKFLTDNLPLLAMDPEMDMDALVEKFLTSRQQTAITFDPAD